MTTVQDVGPESLGDTVSRDAESLATRLRASPESRLNRRLPPLDSAATAAHQIAQRMADLAQAVAERDDAMPCWRAVPWLGPFVVADQVAVTGHDLAAALADPGSALRPDPDRPIWTRSGRVPARTEVDAVLRAIRRLRLAL